MKSLFMGPLPLFSGMEKILDFQIKGHLHLPFSNWKELF